jgi:hypothetical protein
MPAYGVPRWPTSSNLLGSRAGGLVPQAPAVVETPPRPTVVTSSGPLTSPMVGHTGFNIALPPPAYGKQLPTVVAQQPAPVQQPFIWVSHTNPGAVIQPPDVLVHPTAVPLQQITPPWPFTYVAPLRVEPPAPLDTPARPLVVKSVEPPTSLPEVFVAAVRAVLSTDTLPKPAVVRAVELPWTPPQITVVQPRIGETTPPHPTVANAVDLPTVLPFVKTAGVRSEPATIVVPPRPTVAAAVELTPAAPFVKASQACAEPPAAAPQVPIHSTVITAEPPVTAPFVGYTGFSIDSGITLPGDTPQRVYMVAQQPLPQTLPFVSAVQPKVFAVPPPPPDTPQRPTVVKAAEPPPPVDQVLLWTTVSDAVPTRASVVDAKPLPFSLPFVYTTNIRTAPGVFPTIPPRPFVARAVELPPASGFIAAITLRVFTGNPPTQPPKPTVVAGQPAPDQRPTVFVEQPLVTAAPAPDVRATPVVVASQMPLPAAAYAAVSRTPAPDVIPPRPIVATDSDVLPPAGWSTINKVRADPPAAPPDITPPRPTVVTVTSVPAAGQVFVSRPVATESGTVPKPVVVTSTVKPPEVAAAVTSRKWGPPPPVLRAPDVRIVFDVSRPPPAYGRALVRHGFAEALPAGKFTGRFGAERTAARFGNRAEGQFGSRFEGRFTP